MTPDKIVHNFPKYAAGVVELGTLVVSDCYDPNLQQMQNKAHAFLEGVYTEARSTSKDLKGAIALETFMRQTIPIFIEQIHAPDKEVMLFRCQEAKEVMSERAAKFAREKVVQRRPFWRRWFGHRGNHL